MKKPLTGRLALVTGGTRGIGAAIATRLIIEGASVTVTGTHLNGNPPKRCSYYMIDFTDSAATEMFASEVANWGIDVLINNAGINKINPFDQSDIGDYDKIQKVNVRAPFLLCRAVIPNMKQKRWGRIINVSSILSKISMKYRGPYSASKFALDGMTVALAAEVAEYGILANCVAPGFIDTELTRVILGKKGIAGITSKIPIRRLGRPEEIAEFIAWLAGPKNTYISGQNIAIDGGYSRV